MKKTKKSKMRLSSIHEESLVRKLAISFFFMSLIPLMLLMYILKVVGYDILWEKLPYIRVTVALIVCLMGLMFYFLRRNISAVSRIAEIGKEIAKGNYKKKIYVDGPDTDEIGQLAKSFNKITSDLEEKIKELEESKNIIQDIFTKTGAAISSSEGIDQLLGLIIEMTTKGVFGENGCILLLDDKGEKLQASVYYGIDEKAAKKISEKLGEGIIGLSAKEKRTIISSYTGVPSIDENDESRFHYKTIISVPLLYREDCLGVMAIFNKKRSSNFNEDDKLLITNIASQAAVAIANANLNEDAEKTYIETITALAVAVEAKDPYSRGHLDRVSRLVINFSKHLGLSDKTIEVLKDGAKLHDLGKIGVRDEILGKKDKLTQEEEQELQKHVIIGENIMRPIRKLSPLCDMVRYHQEWWDGTGYPDGLKGEEIPLTAKILKMVDAYDAMSTDRPYRKSLSKESIKDEFKKGSGKEFDPKLVDKFLEII
ncbi:MAG: HD domain-containing phosphohydrolase [Candidatus Omnitrophota bacterium]